jgi:hypothetical protein
MAFEPRDVLEFIDQCTEIDATNRYQALDDIRFSYGEQWDTQNINSREVEGRPYMTINKLDAFIRQETNKLRQQNPRMKASPMDDVADPKIAEVITGLLRHIQLQSDATYAYSTAFNFAARGGWGFFRIVTDYINEMSFDQDIYIKHIENPFTVFYDPFSTAPDGSDARRCSISDLISLKEFRRRYPGAVEDGFFAAAGEATDWVTKDEIRLAEDFQKVEVKKKLVMLSDKSIIWEDELPPPELLKSSGIYIAGARDSYKCKIEWRILSAFEVLETKPWAGKYIPVVPVYAENVIVDGKRRKFGLTRFARDPQRIFNFWRTAITESIAMAPKAKWVMAEGQDEGHENEWNTANLSARAVLRYKSTDIDGKEVGPPIRMQPEPPPAGAIEASELVSNDLQAVLGVYDPAIGKPSGLKSGVALRSEQMQSDQSNFHLYDNFTRAVKYAGRIILDLLPHIYDTERVMRIIGEDGKPDLVTINQQSTSFAVNEVLNDVTVGTYDIDMEAGPDYNSKREAAVDAMTTMMQSAPQIMQVAGDLIFRNMNFPGADIIADRLAAANPLAQIDDKSDIPPKVQMMIKQLQAQLQQSQQQLQAQQMIIKSRSDIEQMKENAETNREHMRLLVKTHDIETQDRTKREDIVTETNVKAQDAALDYKKAITVEEIRAHLAILLAKMGNLSEANNGALEERG